MGVNWGEKPKCSEETTTDTGDVSQSCSEGLRTCCQAIRPALVFYSSASLWLSSCCFGIF
ncbi:hypothetical protein EYF80_044192 [Liparis tanakae]|uniref:Uncharacterized protein n=1 Tax=Liparis tanakae TaxID=230148 RepID=A0A4Z2FWH9_9TELE|nr:hypothetical protein EYF80_044192 [Liparis tanakae]